jgi:hypothetical protein
MQSAIPPSDANIHGISTGPPQAATVVAKAATYPAFFIQQMQIKASQVLYF